MSEVENWNKGNGTGNKGHYVETSGRASHEVEWFSPGSSEYPDDRHYHRGLSQRQFSDIRVRCRSSHTNAYRPAKGGFHW